MDILQATSRKRESYKVLLEYSLLWECALGIAAVTNERLVPTLEKSNDYWEEKKRSFSESLLVHLGFVEKNNTWKTLLQLLHQRDFRDLADFIAYIKDVEVDELKFVAIPYLGSSYQELRKQAIGGDKQAISDLKELTKDNPYVPTYIDFICRIDGPELKKHLITVMTEWYKAIIEPEAERLEGMLKRDYEAKNKKYEAMQPEEFVEWATGGVTYAPEPSVHHVLLIPQYVYRPWSIEADIEGVKVFYYPIANESINPTDAYVPDFFLTQKLKALGDEVRLRILKLLSEQDYTLQDLTSQLELGKSTVHHHVKMLRSARLVQIKDSKYSLHQKSIYALPKELLEFLER